MRKYFVLFICVLLFTGCGEVNRQFEGMTGENMIVAGASFMPDSLNFYIDYNTVSHLLGALHYEPLCELDLETLEVRGVLAESWEISEDKRTYTFTLNNNARWADGSPVATGDILFTYQTIMNPDNLTGLFRMGLEQEFEDVYAIDERTIVFKAKKKRWTAFIQAYSFTVLPRKEFAGKDFNKDFNISLPPGSGPYVIEDIKTDRYILLKKREDYWGEVLEFRRGKYLFDRIKYKILKEKSIRYEALKKGEIDMTGVTSAAVWKKMTELEPLKQIQKNWILAKRVWNYKPYGFQGFYFNLRRKKFQDIRVRKALALLLDIDLINEKLMYNAYQPLRSYFPGFFNNDKDLPLIGFDPGEARRLLTEAGWESVGRDGVLRNKNNEPLEIEFTYTSQSEEKHLTIFKEECAKVGVKLNLNLIAPSSIRKKVFTDYDYDMTWGAWGGVHFPGIEDLWRSTYADEPNTNNIAGYKNKRIDELLDQYLEEFDVNKRTALMKEMDIILTSDIPAILLWAAPYTRLMYRNKFGMDPLVLKKYADADDYYDSIVSDWWLDKDKASALEKAIASGESLLPEPVNIYYDVSLEPRE
jgi:microcin C transport system substrate-binding protein